MILPYLTSPTTTRCRTTTTPKKRGGGTAKRCSTCRTLAGLEVRQVRQPDSESRQLSRKAPIKRHADADDAA